MTNELEEFKITMDRGQPGTAQRKQYNKTKKRESRLNQKLGLTKRRLPDGGPGPIEPGPDFPEQWDREVAFCIKYHLFESGYEGPQIDGPNECWNCKLNWAAWVKAHPDPVVDHA
jgi:hypothetical protein